MSEITSSPAPEPPRSLLFRVVVGTVLGLVRVFYKVKAIHPERVPAGGGVLMLSNHVSYVDALILAAACPRPLRFVMWDVLYRVWWMNGFLRFVGTVPISASRGKDAVRTVATALKDGGLVCLFPEGEITRHGMVNEMRKGFELMARQGEAKVVPVWLDGLYGSIFSFQGGRFFTKRPKQLRYPATVFFGEPLVARAPTVAAVRRAMLSMSEKALMARAAWKLAGEDRTGLRECPALPRGGVVWLPGWWVRRTLQRYSEPADRYYGSGAMLARLLLEKHGLTHIAVEKSDTGDHYDLEARADRLSPHTYQVSDKSSFRNRELFFSKVKFDSPGFFLILLICNIFFQLGKEIIQVGIQSRKAVGMIDDNEPAKTLRPDAYVGNISFSCCIDRQIFFCIGSYIKSHKPVVWS